MSLATAFMMDPVFYWWLICVWFGSVKSLGRSEISASFLWKIRGAEGLVSRCNNLANRKMKFWRLQESCKWEKELFGACNNLASEKKTFWRLQQSCKWEKVVFGVCNNLANRKMKFWRLQQSCKSKNEVLALATILQAKKKRFGVCKSVASISKTDLGR